MTIWGIDLKFCSYELFTAIKNIPGILNQAIHLCVPLLGFVIYVFTTTYRRSESSLSLSRNFLRQGVPIHFVTDYVIITLGITLIVISTLAVTALLLSRVNTTFKSPHSL